MSLTIPINPNFNSLEYDRSNLIKDNFNLDNFIFQINRNLTSFNASQITYLTALSANFSLKYKNLCLDFFMKYLGLLIEQGKISVALEMENALYNYYLKANDNEKHYNSFFLRLDKLYKSKMKKTYHENNGNGYAFFIHNGLLLAHINPLLEMLKLNGIEKNKKDNIGIICLKHDKDFFQNFSEIGIKIHLLNNQDTIYNQLNSIPLICNEFKYNRLIWQCLPIYLCYVERIFNNIIWWSHKFRSNIEGLNSYVHTSTNNNDEKVDGIEWKHFLPSFELKNLLNKKNKWENRKLKFATFCRDELIDNKSFWEKIELILSSITSIQFHYASRNNLHEKWIKCENLQNRIKHLGWLKNPEIKLLEYSFIFDPLNFGHGYLMMEALSGEIPVIYNNIKNSKDNDKPFINLKKRDKKTTEIINLKIFNENSSLPIRTDYNNNQDLINLCKNISINKDYNYLIGTEHLKFIYNRQKLSGNWEGFKKIVRNQR